MEQRPTISFEENIGLVHFQAKRGYAWAQGAGLALDYDDIFQEASVAFLLAAEGFDPERGIKFSAYYTTAAFSRFQKAIGVMTGVKNLNPTQREEIANRKEENARRAAAAEAPLENMNYGLSPMAFSHISLGSEEDGSLNFEDALVSDAGTPEQIFELKQDWEVATSNLGPLARLMLEWLEDTPDELARDFEAQSAHSDFRMACGLRPLRGSREGVSINNIGRFLQRVWGITDGELAVAKAQLERMTDTLRRG